MAELSGAVSINSPVSTDIGSFDNISSTTDVDIATTNTTSDTFRLPGGKAYKLTAYVNVSNLNSNGGNIRYQFWSSAISNRFGAEGVITQLSSKAITIAPATAIFYTSSPVNIRLQISYSVDKVGLDPKGTYVIIESL